MRKIILAIVAPLMLGGCWLGPDFYAGEPSIEAIPAGKYKPVEVFALFPEDEERLANEPVGSRIQISYDGRGNIVVKGNEDFGDASNVRLVALGSRPGIYIVQVDPGDGAVAVNTFVYGLVTLTTSGYRLSMPPCNGARRLTPGSPIVVKGLLFKPRCSFRDRASFEVAMRDFADDPTSWTEYRRVQDRRTTSPDRPSTG